MGGGSGARGGLLLLGDALSLVVDVEELLLGLRVEVGNLLAEGRAERLGVVLVEALRDALVLVDLLGLGVRGRGVLAQLLRHRVALADEALARLLVNVVDKVQETRRDTLLVCLSDMKATSKLTVNVDRLLQNVVTEKAAVREVLGSDRSLNVSLLRQ